MVAGDRLPDRIGIGVLAKVFPPDLIDRAVDEAARLPSARDPFRGQVGGRAEQQSRPSKGR